MKTKLLLALVLTVAILNQFLLFNGFYFHVERIATKRDSLMSNEPLIKSYIDAGCTVAYHKRWSLSHGSFLEGAFKITGTNGLVKMSGNYVGGVWEGPLVTFYDNGMLESLGHYLKGSNSSLEVYWNQSGFKLRDTPYQAGRKQGVEVYWDTNCVPLERVEWRIGKPYRIEMMTNGLVWTTYVGDAVLKHFRAEAMKMLPSRTNE